MTRIGEANPQSRLYNEILSTFSDTIRAHRRLVSRNARRAVDQYIDQILVIDVEQGTRDDDLLLNHHNLEDGWCLKEGLNSPLGSMGSTFPGQVEWDEAWFAQNNWNDIAMQFSDNFTIDYSSRLS